MNNEAKEKFRQELADKFIHLLEEKKNDWIQGWDTGTGGPPFNIASGRKYSGINQFTLSLTAMLEGYNDPRWATMTQIRDETGVYHKGEKWHLRKGSHGTKVEYWYPYDRENKKPLTWQEYKKAIDSGREQKEFLIQPKYFTVFNASQIEGIPPLKKVENPAFTTDELIPKLAREMGVMIDFSPQPMAFYNPATDRIHLPTASLFHSSAEFHGTALHELAHATGHPSRLNRGIKNIFGSESYAAEELIAEMTSCFMAADLKEVDLSAFNRFENNAAYLQSWIESIHDKPDALIRAVKEATRATEYMEMKAGVIPESEYDRTKNLDSITANSAEKSAEPDRKIEGNSPEPTRKIEEIYHPDAMKPMQNPSQIRMRF